MRKKVLLVFLILVGVMVSSRVGYAFAEVAGGCGTAAHGRLNYCQTECAAEPLGEFCDVYRCGVGFMENDGCFGYDYRVSSMGSDAGVSQYVWYIVGGLGVLVAVIVIWRVKKILGKREIGDDKKKKK